MKELATQANSANVGTQSDKLQSEFTQLRSEIDRIVGTTNYQGTKLVDGSFGYASPAPRGVAGTSAVPAGPGLGRRDRLGQLRRLLGLGDGPDAGERAHQRRLVHVERHRRDRDVVDERRQPDGHDHRGAADRRAAPSPSAPRA
jgi:hypothetical protein